MSTISKTAEPYLWKVAKQLPYIEHKFSTITKGFTPSFKKIEKPFIKTIIGQK